MNETVDLTNEQQPQPVETPAVEQPVQEVAAVAVEPSVLMETPAPIEAPAPAKTSVDAIIAIASEKNSASASDRGHRKVRIGSVVSNKMQKSIIVSIERRVKHSLYKKYFTLTTRLMAHDEKQEARIGDVVKITETRPLSKRKCWRLVEIIERAK